jgi:Transcriptional regulators
MALEQNECRDADAGIYEEFPQLSKWIFTRKQEALAKIGLTPLQAKVLMQILNDAKTSAQKNLAEELCVTPSAVSRFLDGMEALGLITRRKSAFSRKTYEVSITESGRQKAEIVKGITRDLGMNILRPLSAEERRALYGIFKKLVDFHINHKGIENA